MKCIMFAGKYKIVKFLVVQKIFQKLDNDKMLKKLKNAMLDPVIQRHK